MNEKIKISIITLGMMISEGGFKLIEKQPMYASIIIAAGAVMVAAGIFWIVKQMNDKINELKNKIVGIVGLGRIGRRVAELVKAFGARVIAHDPFISETNSVKLVSLEELLRVSDIITFHVPLTPQTKMMIDEETLRKVKRGAILINTSRGGIWDERAVIEAVKKGLLGGVAMDVFENEPPVDCEKFCCENVIVTPHIGAQTVESKINIGKKIVEYIEDYRVKKCLT